MRANPWTLVLLALLLLTLPLPWVVAAILAAAVHEGSHLGAVRLLGGKTQGLWVGLRGARMEAVLPDREKEILAILAGPAGSLALLLLAGIFPRLALCGLAQGMFNLLPLPPLDGGRALRLLLPQRKNGNHPVGAFHCSPAAKLVKRIGTPPGEYVKFYEFAKNI